MGAVVYFAYGNNMLPATMKELCGSARSVGPGRLDDHRLAFTRKSRRWNAGAADVVPAPGFAVYGVLFEIDEACRAALDRREGTAKRAYEARMLTVKLPDTTEITALTYVVVDKSNPEIAPSSEYLDRMRAAAQEAGIHVRYQEFLERLSGEPADAFRQGFVMRGVQARRGAQGLSRVRLASAEKARFRGRRLCAIEYQGRYALGKIAFSPAVEEGVVEADQSVRRAVGIPGRAVFGDVVRVDPVKEREPLLRLFEPRTLMLRLYRPSINDSEKRIFVLKEPNIRLLGIEDGDYVTARVLVPTSTGELSVRKLTRRVFSGSVDTIMRDGDQTAYPRANEFYVDLDGRLELGLTPETQDVPVLVAPSLARLFRRRLLAYGATLFLGMLALVELMRVVLRDLGEFRATVAGMVFAVVASFLLTWIDLRGRTGL